LSMLVLYLLTGTTRRALITLPAAHASSVTSAPVGVTLPPSTHAPTGAAGPQIIQIVRSAQILRSECLWLTVAATVFAFAAVAVQVETKDRVGDPRL